MSRRSPLAGLARALRRIAPVIAATFVATGLVACSGMNFGNFGFGGPAGPALTNADVIGTGTVRVAFLIPRSASGHGGDTARAFRNAAELALRDFPNAGIQIAFYDTRGAPAGAASAADAALKEGAGIVLGPVFSNEVAAVAPVTRAAGVPVVAFSSDAGVAGPGVYLLSFLPSDDVNRIVSFSASQGRKSFAALLPATAYGSVVEATFRSAVARVGGRVVAIQSYQSNDADVRAKTAAIASIAREVDALLVPDSGAIAPVIAATLAASGITRDKVKLLGSGQWDDPRVLNSPAMVGSWYPAPVKQGFEDFARRYQGAFGTPPPRNATLAYDATVLAIGIVRQYGADRFKNSVLTSPNGFAGIDGIFRFLPSGLTERRLAVYEVTGSGASVISQASRSFAGGT